MSPHRGSSLELLRRTSLRRFKRHRLPQIGSRARLGRSRGGQPSRLGNDFPRGGLPGIPISIVRNDLTITLLDSIRKKTAAVQNMVDALSLSNVDVITGRAEEVRGNKTKWDIVISRAVAPLTQLVEWSKPLLKNSQKKTIRDSHDRSWQAPALIALKGGTLGDEIRDATRLTTVGAGSIPQSSERFG